MQILLLLSIPNVPTTSDALKDEVEKRKQHLTSVLESKEKEIEVLSEEISKLQKKIRYLGEFQKL